MTRPVTPEDIRDAQLNVAGIGFELHASLEEIADAIHMITPNENDYSNPDILAQILGGADGNDK